jgi:hypothetical protein
VKKQQLTTRELIAFGLAVYRQMKSVVLEERIDEGWDDVAKIGVAVGVVEEKEGHYYFRPTGGDK